MKTPSYEAYFIDDLLERFALRAEDPDSAMTTADLFRNDEWRLLGEDPWARLSRERLFALACGNPQFERWLAQVFQCMAYNLSQEDQGAQS